MPKGELVTIASFEGVDFDLDVPSDVADLARSLMFGEFDLEGATTASDHVTLSFTTLEGMEAFIGVCLRPTPDRLSERIAGQREDVRVVRGRWRYKVWPNTIFVMEHSDEPNIVFCSSVTFPRGDLAEVEDRVRARPVEYIVFLEEPGRDEVGTSQRWHAKSKGEALREAVTELEKGEFRRARVIRFDPRAGTSDEEVLTAD